MQQCRDLRAHAPTTASLMSTSSLVYLAWALAKSAFAQWSSWMRLGEGLGRDWRAIFIKDLSGFSSQKTLLTMDPISQTLLLLGSILHPKALVRPVSIETVLAVSVAVSTAHLLGIFAIITRPFVNLAQIFAFQAGKESILGPRI